VTTTAQHSYDLLARHVEEMIDEGTPFSDVENAIDTAHTPQDHKAALWLLAWSLRDP
jgi:hypothetical protein